LNTRNAAVIKGFLHNAARCDWRKKPMNRRPQSKVFPQRMIWITGLLLTGTLLMAIAS
jgi:hypothetical protein